MAYNTTYLDLYGKDPQTDGADTFDISTMLNDNWDKIDAAWYDKVLTASTTSAITLQAGNWSGGEYSLESQFPVATYDILVSLNGDTVTLAQTEAWGSAKVVGYQTRNSIKALGDVPTVDIPVIVRAVKK